MGRGGEGCLRGSIQHFLDIGCRRGEVVIIRLQGKNILYPANRIKDNF